MTEKLVTMDAPYKTFELAPDECAALHRILNAIIDTEMIYHGVTLSMRGTDFDVTIKGVHEDERDVSGYNPANRRVFVGYDRTNYLRNGLYRRITDEHPEYLESATPKSIKRYLTIALRKNGWWEQVKEELVRKRWVA
jgi:hypothetical protein